MIKVVYCIRRRADLSAQEFQRYWKDVHAPMLLENSAALRLAAYVQTSPLASPYSARVERAGVLDTPFDGIAELYWANEHDLRTAFESAEALDVQRRLAEDEANFIDPARSARWVATEIAPIER
ncbi:MAG: EthD domain-containing protein [Betaproteobacteria bacterium]|jgi:uncharacterized protein (TIGR02118 family)|nr:EthD domain-containing protein [Pseudomonadota bacterium]MBK7278976.1 EthD domain-containing protein [Betaproteobacteria bacterium]MBK7458108.1 EthD domain-containing protein [Betaproteobacteria bacterium]MBK8107413.1 EthD domain-containing protein [Betaproteobacteria bacterium]MBK8864079.1 EthD domain-containing protein [Betaproteobacteria bacterium]